MLAPSLLAIPGCAALTAAKIIGETAGIDRFRSKDSFARHNGTAPLPVWSSNHARPSSASTALDRPDRRLIYSLRSGRDACCGLLSRPGCLGGAAPHRLGVDAWWRQR
ncbi:IS110 family transposase [Gordonia sputi]|nr:MULTISPECIES: IS110 family transposase [Gordonia]MCM3896432.1 IS110 family transposase [Gordonia sputi]